MRENKATITKDLQEIYDFLIENQLCKDPKPLADAIECCDRNSTSDYYDYKISNLEIDVCDTISGAIPQGVIVDKIIFSITIRGRYIDYEHLCDPILQVTNKKRHENYEYAFNIEIYGHRKMNDAWEDLYYSSWHLDKHLEQDQDGETKYYHPLYHLAFGGKKMEKDENNYGQALILPSPRIAHPPMDAVLGIDFIVQNYLKLDSHRNMTRKNTDYEKMLKRSQNRLWRPYYAAIGEHWKNTYHTVDSGLDKIKLIPVLK